MRTFKIHTLLVLLFSLILACKSEIKKDETILREPQEILDEIKIKPEVCSVFHTTGEQSAALICRFKEAQDVHNFIRDLNEKEFITKTNSNMVLKEYKNTSIVLS